MRIYRKINHLYLKRSKHLIILSNERPLDGEWAFDYRPDENGKLHPCVYRKQVDLHIMDTSTERAILASNRLPQMTKIPDHQYKTIVQRYEDGYPCDIMIEYEDYPVESFGMTDGEPTIAERIKINEEGFCNIHEAGWNKTQLVWELNHILNVAVCQGKLKERHSNGVAEFVDNWMKKKYKL